MTITISLIDALLIVLAILAVILLYQLIVLFRNLIPSAKSLSKIMDDAAYITNTARNGTEDAKDIVSNFAASLSNVSNALHGNQSTLAAITNLTNACANIVGFAKRGEN